MKTQESLVCIVYTAPEEKVSATRSARRIRTRGRSVTVLYSPPETHGGCPCTSCAIDRVSPLPRTAKLQGVLYLSPGLAEKYARRPLRARRIVRDQALSNGKRNRKDRARAIVARAIRSGLLVRPTICDFCKRHKDDPDLIRVRGRHQQVIQADHMDYDEPLKVSWLCIPCHRTRTNAWHIAWTLRQRVKYPDHPLPPHWWCWLCHSYHRECLTRMSPVDYPLRVVDELELS